jgi:hypothetical protein
MSSGNSTNEKEVPQTHDVEKHAGQPVSTTKGFFAGVVSRLTVKDGEVYEAHSENNPKWYQRLLDVGIEENGIKPVPVEARTNTQYNNLFTIFFTCLLCLLP